MMTRQNIAIIGTGISGLTCAHHLASKHDLTIFEAEDYVGGHTHTVRVEKDGEVSDIDTGFIVFNDHTYPEFIKMMDSIGVSYQPTEMSFSVRNDAIDLEYNGNTLNSLFAQRRNILRPSFLGMVRDIVRFNKEVRHAADDEQLTIGGFLASRKYSDLFKENYLLPMISAIWSMGLESCKDFPLQFFVRFFDNHGLLNIVNRPQWYTIIGGSSSYIEPLSAPFKDNIRINTPVMKVEREGDKVQIVTSSGVESFDQVIFACHGNQALSLLASPTASEETILRPFQTSSNSVVLHTDTSFLPKRPLGWASWNYNMVDSAKEQTTLTYNMNILQQLSKEHTYLVTLNQEIAKEHVLKEFNYHHPIFSLEAIKAQAGWEIISGKNRSHYCGAYWFNGFHEDGVKSGIRVKNARGDVMKPALYIGTIAHRRRIPVEHRFQYPFFMWFLNLDELDQLSSIGRWFSTKRWAMSRFHRPDYYGDSEIPLADAIRYRMEELTGEPVTGQVCGLLNMRTLGVYFSPVNFYYGYDDKGDFSHFLAEVSNIPWNERHQYAHYVGNGAFTLDHPKEFHVSPFNDENQHYSWALEEPGSTVSVQLDVSDERGHIFTAQLGLNRHPLNLQSVRARILRKPAMTMSIVAGIYWQAFNLFRKGVPYISYSKETT